GKNVENRTGYWAIADTSAGRDSARRSKTRIRPPYMGSWCVYCAYAKPAPVLISRMSPNFGRLMDASQLKAGHSDHSEDVCSTLDGLMICGIGCGNAIDPIHQGATILGQTMSLDQDLLDGACISS